MRVDPKATHLNWLSRFAVNPNPTCFTACQVGFIWPMSNLCRMQVKLCTGLLCVCVWKCEDLRLINHAIEERLEDFIWFGQTAYNHGKRTTHISMLPALNSSSFLCSIFDRSHVSRFPTHTHNKYLQHGQMQVDYELSLWARSDISTPT